MIGQKVKTPYGEGVEQGEYAMVDAMGAVVSVRRLVRIVINDETVRHLQDANCLTPRAVRSALFTFGYEEAQ